MVRAHGYREEKNIAFLVPKHNSHSENNTPSKVRFECLKGQYSPSLKDQRPFIKLLQSCSSLAGGDIRSSF